MSETAQHPITDEEARGLIRVLEIAQIAIGGLDGPPEAWPETAEIGAAEDWIFSELQRQGHRTPERLSRVGRDPSSPAASSPAASSPAPESERRGILGDVGKVGDIGKA